MAHILIVEDEDNIAVALEFLLTLAGHSHRRLATGAGAPVDKVEALKWHTVAKTAGKLIVPEHVPEMQF